MYALCYAPGSANMPAHLTPLECDAPYQLDLDAGQQHSAAYPALNPNGVVPTLAEGLTEWA